MSEFRKSPLPVSKPRRPEVVFTPRSRLALIRGANQIVDALRPTLGPSPRFVAMARYASGDPPELLDDGATIARRIIQVHLGQIRYEPRDGGGSVFDIELPEISITPEKLTRDAKDGKVVIGSSSMPSGNERDR